MAKQTINNGTVAGDGTGEDLFTAFGKVNANFTELYDADLLKAPLASPTFTGTVSGITKAMVGLTNVDDTSDATKITNAAASQAEQEAATSNVKFVTPGRQHFHPSALKCFAMVSVAAGVPTLQRGYNITSITDTAVGQLTITIATDFSDAFWACTATVRAGASGQFCSISSTAAGSVTLNSEVGTTLTDPVAWHMQGAGDH